MIASLKITNNYLKTYHKIALNITSNKYKFLASIFALLISFTKRHLAFLLAKFTFYVPFDKKGSLYSANHMNGLVVFCWLCQWFTKTFYPALALAIWNQFGIDVSLSYLLEIKEQLLV